MTTPIQPLGGKLRKDYEDVNNDLVLDASEVKIQGRDGTGNIPRSANSLEDVIEVVNDLSGGNAVARNGNTFDEDRIVINNDATSQEPQYIIFKNGLRDASNDLHDGRLIWNSAGDNGAGELQITKLNSARNSLITSTLLHHQSNDNEFPSFLARTSAIPDVSGIAMNAIAVSSLQTSLNDLAEDVSEIDISGIETNAAAITTNTNSISTLRTGLSAAVSNISGLDGKVQTLENAPRFQLSQALTEFEHNLNHTHTNSISEDYASGYRRALQLNIPSRTSRAGSFEAGSDLDNNGDGTDDVTYNGTFGNINGLPDTEAELNNSIIIIEFGIGVGVANSNFLEYERSDDASGNQWIRLDSSSKLSLQKPGTGHSNAVGDIQKIALSPLAGQTIPVDATPATGDILALAIEYLPNNAIRFIPMYYSAATGSINGGNDIDFTNSADEFGLNQLHIENLTIGNVSRNAISKVVWLQHSGYERHDLLRALLEHGRDSAFFGAKTYNTSSTSTQSYEADFEFESNLKVPVKAEVGTLQIGQTELTETQLKSLLTEIHFPEEIVTRTDSDGLYSMVAGDVDKYVSITITGPTPTFSLANSLGEPGDIMFIHNSGSNNFNVSNTSGTVATLQSGEVIPFVKVADSNDNESWVILTNRVSAASGLNQGQVDTRVNALVQQFALDTTTRLTKSKLPADVIYGSSSSRISDTLLPAPLERLNDLEIAGNNGKFIWINGGNFAIGGGYKTERANYTSTLADYGWTIGLSAQSQITANLPRGASVPVGWHVTFVKDNPAQAPHKVKANTNGNFVHGDNSDAYIAESVSGDEIELHHPGDSATFVHAAYDSGNNINWWYIWHNLHDEKLPPPVRTPLTTEGRFLSADKTWAIPSVLFPNPSDTTYTSTADPEDTDDFYFKSGANFRNIEWSDIKTQIRTGLATTTQLNTKIGSADVQAPARTTNTSRWGKDKLPTDTIFASQSFRIAKNLLPTDVVYSDSTRFATPSEVAILTSDLSGQEGKYMRVTPHPDAQEIEFTDLDRVWNQVFSVSASANNNFQDTTRAVSEFKSGRLYRITYTPTIVDNTKHVGIVELRYPFAGLQTRTVGTNAVGADFEITGPNIYRLAQTSAGDLLIDNQGIAGTLKVEELDEVHTSTDLTDMPTETEYNSASTGQVLAKSASGGYELIDQTGGGGTATPPVNVTPNPAATTLTLTADQLNDYDELWFFADGPPSGDTIPIALSTAAMKAMSFTGEDEIRYSGQMRAQWNHTNNTLTTGTNILYAELRKFSGGGGSSATTASDLLDLIDNSEGNVDAAASTDSSKIKLTAPSGGGRVTEARDVTASTNTTLTAAYVNKANFVNNGGNTVRLTADNAVGVNGDKIIIFHAGPSTNIMVVDATSPLGNRTTNVSWSMSRGHAHVIQKFSGKWYHIGDID